jgi:hypothetical protein
MFYQARPGILNLLDCTLHSPLGVAIGLGVRESFNANGAAMAGTSGVLDAFSAGILLYTGLVEVSRANVCWAFCHSADSFDRLASAARS